MSFGVSPSIGFTTAAMFATFAAIALVILYTVSSGRLQAATTCVE